MIPFSDQPDHSQISDDVCLCVWEKSSLKRGLLRDPLLFLRPWSSEQKYNTSSEVAFNMEESLMFLAFYLRLIVGCTEADWKHKRGRSMWTRDVAVTCYALFVFCFFCRERKCIQRFKCTQSIFQSDKTSFHLRRKRKLKRVVKFLRIPKRKSTVCASGKNKCVWMRSACMRPSRLTKLSSAVWDVTRSQQVHGSLQTYPMHWVLVCTSMWAGYLLKEMVFIFLPCLALQQRVTLWSPTSAFILTGTILSEPTEHRQNKLPLAIN